MVIRREQARFEESVTPLEYLDHVCRSWRTVLISCGVAAVLATIVSLLLTKQYTAVASMVIEPPAGNDPRAATAVSPVYLESLRTYELFASSDTLFAQALDKLHLRKSYAGTPIEQLKRKLLRVSKPKDTKVIEIRATLADPQKAQALANYIADATVRLNRSLEADSQREIDDEAQRLLDSATVRLKNAEAAREKFLATDPIENLESEISERGTLRVRLQGDRAEAQADLAGYQARLKTLLDEKNAANAEYIDSAREQVAAATARVNTIARQQSEIERSLQDMRTTLEKRKNRRDQLDAERLSARAQFEGARTKYDDIVSSAAFRGERLKIIDPGTVPERPSFPNIPLNIVAAIVASSVLCLLYLALELNYIRIRSMARQREYLEKIET